MNWNEEKVEKLKELWGKGNTASQIAEIIGGISRNAVIGKAHRLNLSAKIKTRTVQNNPNSTKEDKVKFPLTINPQFLQVIIFVSHIFFRYSLRINLFDSYIHLFCI